MLIQMISEGEDVSKVCTTKITEMSADSDNTNGGSLFGSINDGTLTQNDFNQDISSWDVSNVTSMLNMFFSKLISIKIFLIGMLAM